MKSSKQILTLINAIFSLNFHYSVGVSFVLISCLFAEQYLFENFVPILEQFPMPMLQRHLACLHPDQSAIPTIELPTVPNLFRGNNNEINFLQELI